MSIRSLLSRITLLLVLFPLAAEAQPAQPAGLRARVRAEVRQKVEQRIAAALKLDPATSARLKEIGDRYDDQIAAMQRDSGQARRQLKQLLDQGGGDVATINQLADRMLGNRARIQGLENQRSQAVRQILTPQQYGWLLIAWPRITRAVKVELWRALAAERGGAALPPPPGGEEQPEE